MVSSTNRLADAVRSFAGIRVLVIGDVMLDTYIHGNVERISPEAPVPVLKVQRESYAPGGAANAACNLAAMGAEVTILGIIGNDDAGLKLVKSLQEKGITTNLVVGKQPTVHKVRIVSRQQIMRYDYEEQIKHDERSFAATALRLGKDVDVIVLSDYAKGTLNEETVQAAVSTGMPTIVDPKPKNINWFKGCSVIKPNQAEAEQITGIRIAAEEDLNSAGAKLVQMLGADVVLTRAEHGTSVFERTGRSTHLPAITREVSDVTGAGDTLMAALALGIAAKLQLSEAALIANHAAGLKVAKAGTVTVSNKELIAALEGPTRKVKQLDHLRVLLADARKQGKKVVFTNGCFDLLHVGHTRLLQAAKSFGDILVLGLNTDDSIRRLKGPSRPITAQDERAEILSSIQAVDHLVFFDEDTPTELIKAIRPDVLVKGGDYNKEGVVGHEFVESYGGSVQLVQFAEGRSTSRIVERLRQ